MKRQIFMLIAVFLLISPIFAADYTILDRIIALQGGSWTVSSVLTGEVEVTQPTHDDLNCNANSQWNNADVSATNGLPVMLYSKNNIQLSCEALSYPNLRTGIWGGANMSVVSQPGDGVANTVYGLVVNSRLIGYNGTTWDRLKSDTTYGLDVDITRLSSLVAGSAHAGSFTAEQDTADTWKVSLASVPSHAVTNAGTFAVQAACTGTFWQATQPVSAAALPLPAGAATSALQLPDSHNVTVDNADVNPVNVGGITLEAIKTSVELIDNAISGNEMQVDVITLPTLANVTTVATVMNLAQQGGVAISLNTGVRDTGTQRVTIATNDIVPTSQSGTWTVQPGNTPNTTAWKVDGSAVTQPVSGTVTANAGTNLNTSALATSALQLADGHNVTIDNLDANPVNVGGVTTEAIATSVASVDGKITACNTGAVVVSTLPTTPAGTNLIGKVGIDQTTPGTTNGVQVNAALPAGTANIGDVDIATIAAGDNNIGNVDIVTLPALVAGTANIGDVDIASAIPAGTNLIGKVGIDQTTPGTTNGVQVNAALPAGTNNIGDVDVITLPALVAGTANIGDVDVLTMPNVGIAVPTVYNLALTTANTQYSQAFSNAESITFQNRSESDIRYAWVTGKVATPNVPYMTLKSGYVFSKDNINIASGTMYFAHGVGGITVEIEVW